MFAVQTWELSKEYGDVRSLQKCSMRIPEGIVFGLLGPNGAGKSTLLRILMGFVQPTSGRAEVNGLDVRRQSLDVRSSVAYLPGDARLYRGMRGSGVLDFFADLHQHGSRERSRRVAQRLDLDLRRRVMFMSTGMRQKLALAVVLGCQAPIVILDEPTANLDPNVRSTVLELVREVRQDGRTVILSSHIFSDIDETTDEVAILRSGQLVAQQVMHELSTVHIVTGELTTGQDTESLLQQLGGTATVQHLVARATGVRTVELHLKGEPSDWLNKLHASQLKHVSIQRAGINSIYQKVHASGLTQSAGSHAGDLQQPSQEYA